MCFEKMFNAAGLLCLPYPSSPLNDDFIFSFLVSYLHTVKGLPLESIRAFTTYDYINLNNQSYSDWVLTDFETQLLSIYFRYIRVNWVNTAEDSTVLVSSPCGLYLSGKFFLNSVGGSEWTVKISMVKDLQNQNYLDLTTEKPTTTTRRRRTEVLSVNQMRNCGITKAVVHEKCLLQQWSGIDVDEKCPGGRGRGILAAKRFRKNEIIVDYHARQISKDEAAEIENDPEDYRYNYLFSGPNSLFWDGSPESCVCHPQSRLLGRLANFAKKNTHECNASPQLFQFKESRNHVFHTIILIATREIAVQEEIRFDYGDKN